LKKLLVATTALLAVGMVAPASPADLVARPYTAAPVMAAPAYHEWSGFYIGANGGWGSSRKCFEALPAGTNVLAGTFELTGDEGCHDATGGVAGGQIGYRWQASSWIFGLEAEGNWADLSGSRLSAAFGNPASGGFIDRTRIDAFGLFTGQIGYAYDSVLLYAKGGAAVTRDRYDIFSTTVPFALPQFGTGSETRWGGAAGVGLEFGFAPGWSIGVEYHHLFMGTQDVPITYNTAGFFRGLPVGTLIGTQSERIRQDVDLITVRLNYHFDFGNGPVVARY